MSERKVSVRIPEEYIERLKGNASATIRAALEKHFAEEELREAERLTDIPKEVEKDTDLRFPVGVGERFKLPIGDVVCYGTSYASSQLWWCPQDRVSQVRELARVFTDSGFTFHVGREDGGTWEIPEVIQEKEQERRPGGAFHVSTRMTPAYVTDVMVWLEIKDVRKALDVLKTHSALPCAVRCDIHRYSDDPQYKIAYDIANGLFMYYCREGRPKKVIDTTREITTEELVDIYDL